MVQSRSLLSFARNKNGTSFACSENMSQLMQDLRYAFRMMLKNPGFTIIVLLTLALGIGANTAIFTIVNAILIRPLPMPHPERLVAVSSTVQRENLERRSVSYLDYLDWRSQNDVFEKMAAYEFTTFTMSESAGAEQVEGEMVTSDFFPLLGIRAALGRTLEPGDDRSNSAGVVVISYGLWKRRFASDPSLIGGTIRLDGVPFTIVGVLQEGFAGVDDDTEVWMPIA